jgi:YD repeat-containing protein
VGEGVVWCRLRTTLKARCAMGWVRNGGGRASGRGSAIGSAASVCVTACFVATVASAQTAILSNYSGVSGTLTKDPQGTGASGVGIAQPVALSWRDRGVGIDGSWREPWWTAQVAANPGEPAALGDATIAELRLSAGVYAPTETDLHLPCHGPEWVIGRTRRSLSAGAGEIHGRGWHQSSQSQLVFWDRPGNADDVVFVVYGGDRYAEYRRVMNGSFPTGTYRGVNGAAGAVSSSVFSQVGSFSGGTPETPIPTWTFHDPAGMTVTFFGAGSTRIDGQGGTHTGSWQVWKITDAAGQAAYVGHPTDPGQALILGYDSSGRITTAFDAAGRRFDYTYGTVGAAGHARLGSVIATLGGATVGSVQYSYFAADSGEGDAGDLYAASAYTPALGGAVEHKHGVQILDGDLGDADGLRGGGLGVGSACHGS